MSAWWSERTPRERVLVLVMLALLAALAAWLLVMRPLSEAKADARARYALAAGDLAEARAQATEVERLERLPPPQIGAPVDAFLAGSAAEAGFAGSRVTAAGEGRAAIVVPAARPQALFGWIDGLQRRGLAVERLRAAANSDRTLSAELIVRLRGS